MTVAAMDKEDLTKIFNLNIAVGADEGTITIPYYMLGDEDVLYQDQVVLIELGTKANKGWLYGQYAWIIIPIEDKLYIIKRRVLEENINNYFKEKRFSEKPESGKILKIRDSYYAALHIDIAKALSFDTMERTQQDIGR